MTDPKFKNELGLVHVITGNGKGKTTSALGTAMRAVGHGFRVYVIQFMKGGRFYGEVFTAEKLLNKKMKWAQFGQSSPQEIMIRKGEVKPEKAIFLPFENESEKMQEAMNFAEKVIMSNKYDLVILDEINMALHMKHINKEDVLKMIMQKPKNVELILTGRSVPKEIMMAADYVNEVKSIKHPFDTSKILGRRGIEY